MKWPPVSWAIEFQRSWKFPLSAPRGDSRRVAASTHSIRFGERGTVKSGTRVVNRSARCPNSSEFHGNFRWGAFPAERGRGG
jgi:hypothetical protein